MPTPTNRTPIRVARGTYNNLSSSLSDIQEERFVTLQIKIRYMLKKALALSTLDLTLTTLH